MKNTNITLSVLLGIVGMVCACTNMTDPPALPQARTKVSFSVAASGGRTVLPSAEDIAVYRLFGGKEGAEEEEQLAEFTTGTVTIALEVATWRFTLNAYNTAGDIVLRDTVPNKTLESGGNNQVVFDLMPLIMTGKGRARVTILFPDYMGITSVTATGDLPGESVEIAAGGGTYTWEQNDINSGYYFVSFALYRESVRVSVVSEMVLVGTGLTSGKVITLSGNDLSPSLYTIAVGTTLTEKLDWLAGSAQSGGNYLVEVGSNESIVPRVIGYTDKHDISVTLIGLEAVRTIDLASNGSMFTVGGGVTLALGNNVTLKGRADNTASLVRINEGGRLILENGAVITGNTAAAAATTTDVYSYGGAVYVAGGIFTMNGGEITENTVSSSFSPSSDHFHSPYSYGGGVYVAGGIFTMNGGEITENTASSSSKSYAVYAAYSYGGGVHVGGGTFAMNGGEITENTVYAKAPHASNSYGGGVSVAGGTFTMRGGEITENTDTSDRFNSYGGGVYVGGGGTFIIEGGKITGNTAHNVGGVYVDGGTFMMSGGGIMGNTSGDNYYGATPDGGGVYVDGGGTFTMRGGEITGNLADDGGGVHVDDGTFTIEGGEITGNRAGLAGGGVYVGARGTLTMNGGTITGNTALYDNYVSGDSGTFGGGVYVDGGTLTMNGGKIAGNTAHSGGCVYMDSGTFTMRNGAITGNTASCGGGVWVETGTFTIEGGEIAGNTASYAYGGGVYVKNGTFMMRGGKITGNTACLSSSYSSSSFYSRGGGVYIETGTFTIEGGEIAGNTASRGGGVYMYGGTFTMNGGNITENTAYSSSYSFRSHGGGVYVNYGEFIKTGGIITGYADDPINGNVVKNVWGNAVDNSGFAVYAYISDTSSNRKETTAGTTTELFYACDNDSRFWSGSWDYSGDMPLLH